MDVYCLNIKDLSRSTYKNGLRRLVSQERRHKADKFHNIKDAMRCVCGEVLLRYCLFKAKGYHGDISLGYNAYGKPFLLNIEDFYYNISHSGDWVVMGYENSEVGIDIERIQEGVEGIANNYFSEHEKQYIIGGGEESHSRRVINVWTLKESYIKYLGMGLSKGLDSFSIIPNTGEVIEGNQRVENVQAYSYEIDNDYVLAVCGQFEDVIIHQVDISEILNVK